MPAAAIYDDILHRIYGADPYDGFDPSPLPIDLQGWGSNHPNFEVLIEQLRPRLIIEVGTWKGGSAVHMANVLRDRGMDTAILCVDTWLGAMEFWERKDDPDRFLSFRLKNGYPQVYYQFLANVVHSGHARRIIPFPTTSSIAARFFKRYGIHTDMLYLDASHDEIDVWTDLLQLWPIIRPGGVIFGDDYTSAWPGLCNAVNNFAKQIGLPLDIRDRQWVLQKPASAAVRAA